MKRLVCTKTLVFLICSLLLSMSLHVLPAEAEIIDITFNQADFNIGVNSLANSDWGEANLQFQGTSGVQFFNLVTNGSWQIQNAPVLSLDGPGVSQSLTFNFNLGNQPGVNVSSINFVASLTEPMLSAPPPGVPSAALVNDAEITFGGRGGPVGPIPSATPIIGKLPTTFAFNTGMVNQDVGVDECSPGAFSNSLMWLDDRNTSISIPAGVKSVDGLKGPTGWQPPSLDAAGNPIPGTGGTPATDWMGKRDALRNFVTTTSFGAADIEAVKAEMRRGEDIEILGFTHAAVLTCAIDYSDGSAALCVTHDTMQGIAGGTKTQVLTFDPAMNRFTSGAYGFNPGTSVDRFIAESPIPEPSTWLLLASGLAGLAILRMTRNQE